jgi:uncharacterized repeat protein (TIGR03803 family)
MSKPGKLNPESFMKTCFKKRLLMPALIIGLGLILTGRAVAQTNTILHKFTGSNGANPHAGLILSGNTLYGTTSQGGSLAPGTVFRIDTDGMNFTNLYNFKEEGDDDGILTNSDGDEPLAGLILSGNTLYGTGSSGGTSGDGTVFNINTDGSSFTNMHNFTGSDGFGPEAGLIISGNTLYGTAFAGGSGGKGTVFAINTDGSGFTNLYNFTATDPVTGTNSDGAFPQAGLIISGNTLYGTTTSGGTNGEGTVFAINTNGMGFRNLYSFTTTDPPIGTNSDGANPQAGLILSGNTLYGTASGGGIAGKGTVFAINTDGSGFTNLYSFTATDPDTGTNSDGANPVAGLILSGNTLYGTATSGGSSGNGTVFAIHTDGTGFTNLYSFNGGGIGDGSFPLAGLILSGSTLYGTTDLGGSSGNGTVFSLSVTLPSAPQLTIMLSGTNVILTWPTNVTGFTLQTATNLVSPVVWIPVSGQNAVTNPVSGKQMFYRLSQ